MTQVTQLSNLKNNPLPSTDIKMGFMNAASFELMQRAAKMMANSTLVPAAYQSVIRKYDRYGNITEQKENQNAISNCVIAINMAARMNADPLMVAQNLYIVEGRPSWSSQFIIAAINSCGRFSPLRFDIKTLGRKTVKYTHFTWEDKKRIEKTDAVEVTDKVCIAWAIEKETGERIESPSVSIEMAVNEGWYSKNGSKWKTMDEVMLRYRTASFFGKLYAPELLMGLQTAEEIHDMVIDAHLDENGIYKADIESLRPKTESEAIDQGTGELTNQEDQESEPDQKPAEPSPEPMQSSTEKKPQTESPKQQPRQRENMDLG